ncbi:arginine deiminase family protein, partial [Vibrio sp. 10N.222.54.F6]
NQDVEVLLLHDLLVETLAVAPAREWLLNTQISDFRYGPTFARDLREYLAQMDNEHLATILLGGLAYSELPI